MENLDNFITLRQAAQLTGYNSDYLSSLIRSGKIPGKKIGKNWLTTRDDVTRYFSVASSLHTKHSSSIHIGRYAKAVFTSLLLLIVAVAVLYCFAVVMFKMGYMRHASNRHNIAVSSESTVDAMSYAYIQ